MILFRMWRLNAMTGNVYNPMWRRIWGSLLKVSRFVIDRMLKSGQLPAAKLGGQYRVRTDDFLKWWDQQVKQEQKKYFKRLPEITGNLLFLERDTGVEPAS